MNDFKDLADTDVGGPMRFDEFLMGNHGGSRASLAATRSGLISDTSRT